jgi:hypothetical protein
MEQNDEQEAAATLFFLARGENSNSNNNNEGAWLVNVSGCLHDERDAVESHHNKRHSRGLQSPFRTNDE